MSFPFLESIRQTTSAQFAMAQSRATITGFLNPASVDLLDTLTTIIGGCEPRGDGRLSRTLPIAHPQYPWLFAESVSVTGIGFNERLDADPNLEAPSLLTYASYQLYRLEIQFSPRPFAVLSDDSIELRPLNYTDDSGNAVATTYANEYTRFTDYDGQPSAEYITAQQGQFVFRAAGVAGNNNPEGATVPGQVRLLQNKSTIKFTWSQVPLSYIEPTFRDTSYIEDAIGHVNQLEWYGWPAGTLLFLAPTFRRYVPVNPGFSNWYETSAVSTNKLVDIEFTFQRFAPRTDPALPPPPRPQHKVTAGHNLLPWFGAGGQYHYYAESTIGDRSLYPSFPFQLLFTDPDA